MSDGSNTSRILTLVFADLADSTALKTQRGDQAVGELITRHRAHIRRLASECGGRIIDWAGDGCFLTFDTPSAAVLFSLRLQQAHRLEADLPAVRIGLHLGEVSEYAGPDGELAQPRVEGLAVDLAARICGLARPTQVLMSSAVAMSAQQRLGDPFGQPVQWRAHGSYTLKGVASVTEIHEAGFAGMSPLEPPVASEKAIRAQPLPRTTMRLSRPAVIVMVILTGLVIAELGWWWMTSRPSRPPPPPPQAEAILPTTPVSPPTQKSIAVLPFVNMSSDLENEYFSDGITEDLLTALSKVSGLRVAARTSSFAYKGKNEDVRTIGTTLNVGAVLEGSVAKAGNQVRITTQLINTADGYHLWSEHYDRELKDIFAIRSEIAQTVSQALQVTLLAGEQQALARKPTENLEAYQLYLKGQQATATANDFTAAADYLQQAIAIDPTYALAYNSLAYYYWLGGDWLMAGSHAFSRSREAAEKALQFDPSLAEPHVWLGFAHLFVNHDAVAAEREIKTALAMQPALATIHQYYGWFLGETGRLDAGIAASRQAVALDPLSAEASTWLAVNLYLARRYEEAIAELRATLSSNPEYAYGRLWLGRAYARTGRYAEAIKELQHAEQTAKFGHAEYASALGRAYADSGDIGAAAKKLEELRARSSTEFVSAVYIALLQVGLHDTDGALASLAQSIQQHSFTVYWWKIDPELDALREEPRFVALMKEIGLAL